MVVRKLVVAACVLFFGSASAASAATDVFGGSVANQHWTAAGSPYLVHGDITVPFSATLRIDDGVTVWVDGTDNTGGGLDPLRVEIVVLGNLLVGSGAPGAPAVTFSVNPAFSKARWWGIRFAAGAQTAAGAMFPVAANGIWGGLGHSDPTHVTISDAIYGIFSDTTLLVGSMTVRNYECAGIWLHSGAPLARLDFSGSMIDSVALYGGTDPCTDMSVLPLGGYFPTMPLSPSGIWLTGNTEALIANTLIYGGPNNTSDGVDVNVESTFGGGAAVVGIGNLTIDHANAGISIVGIDSPGPSAAVISTIVSNALTCGISTTSPAVSRSRPTTSRCSRRRRSRISSACISPSAPAGRRSRIPQSWTT